MCLCLLYSKTTLMKSCSPCVSGGLKQLAGILDNIYVNSILVLTRICCCLELCLLTLQDDLVSLLKCPLLVLCPDPLLVIPPNTSPSCRASAFLGFPVLLSHTALSERLSLLVITFYEAAWLQFFLQQLLSNCEATQFPVCSSSWVVLELWWLSPQG